MGLKKYGKGDWRNIARNFVTTRTPTQVASHAQKYFIRQLNRGKDKRRSSIHDITIVNLKDHASPSADTNKDLLQDQPSSVEKSRQPSDLVCLTQTFYSPKVANRESLMVFNSSTENSFMTSTPRTATYGHSLKEQTMHRSIFLGSQCGAQTMVFHVPSVQHRQ
uniref:HTH myb-type domain-containing protein n=1 Tax=Kalanchoe fedtschenkoi TaxID=63787 RepID=A0A7N0ZX45_KALFE